MKEMTHSSLVGKYVVLEGSKIGERVSAAYLHRQGIAVAVLREGVPFTYLLNSVKVFDENGVAL